MKTTEGTSERLDALEARIAALERKAKPSPIENSVQILTGRQAEGPSGFAMPSESEMKQLYGIVLRKFPQLGQRDPVNPRWAESDKREHFATFVNAFRALGDFGRADAPDTKRAAAFWVDRAEERLRSEGISGGLGLPAFTAAIAAHGDIPFTPLDRFPYDVAFGLRDGGVGRPAVDAWRRVIETGRLLPPVAVAPAYAPSQPQQLRIVG